MWKCLTNQALEGVQSIWGLEGLAADSDPLDIQRSPSKGADKSTSLKSWLSLGFWRLQSELA